MSHQTIINKVQKKEYFILSINSIIGLITKEEDDCFCANAIEENELDVNFNNENNAPITYTSKWTHLKKTPVIDVVENATYIFYDVFLQVFNKLFGLKDNIIAIIPTDHDENSLDTYDRTGLLTLSV